MGTSPLGYEHVEADRATFPGPSDWCAEVRPVQGSLCSRLGFTGRTLRTEVPQSRRNEPHLDGGSGVMLCAAWVFFSEAGSFGLGAYLPSTARLEKSSGSTPFMSPTYHL